MIQAINQGLGSILDVRTSSKESYFIKVFHKSVANFARVARLNQVIKKASPYILELVAVTGLLGIILVLLNTGHDAAGLVPILALYGAAIVRLRQSIGHIVGSVGEIQYSGAAIESVVTDLERLEPIGQREKENAKQGLFSQFSNTIEVCNITYNYPDTEKAALKDISLTIEKGESIGFVGSTGSGKSTLVNIILGLLKPQQGDVIVDGESIYRDLEGWRKHVGYIPQTIVLLDDSIRRNVAFGVNDKDIDEEQLNLAIEAAQLSEFVDSLPDGLDTITGERGVRLSGGQRQRIGLARALYDNPLVLVLDEATSALDNHTENLVMQTLDSLKEGRTFIVIAHRLTTVQKCDRLYFLDNGLITAQGTFEELRVQHQAFKKMVEAV